MPYFTLQNKRIEEQEAAAEQIVIVFMVSKSETMAAQKGSERDREREKVTRNARNE